MYLKKLEIHGFKSFADKTSLDFKPGVVIIVGPNGSGKSNIADAIRWVLGEQSVKSLRGGKMEDVIFAGSEQRRSLGMAEVSLTLDNTQGVFPLEFNEITVTRRLFRSGDSDYLINRVPCRLRDVHELFMDTGIGKEGISIIGQGKIDEILSVKPEERRVILEDAAGIVKFRHRKKEAERKLSDTETNLIRINDIIVELNDQEEPLAEQARVAEIYKGLKQELDGLEIGLIIDEIELNQRRLNNLEKNRAQEEQEIEKIKTEFFSAQSQEEEQKLALQKHEEKFTAHQERVYTENIRLEKNEGEKNLISERIQDMRRQEEGLEAEIGQLKTEQDSIQTDYDDHQRRGSDLHSQLAEKRGILKDFEEALEEENWNDQKLYEELEALKSEHFDALQEETKVNNDFNASRQRLTILDRQLEQLETKQNNTQLELDQVREKLSSFENESAEINRLGLDKEEKLQEAYNRQSDLENLYKETEKQNRSLHDERNNFLARQKVLLEMEKEGQGYGQGVKELLRLKSQGLMSGLLGTVAQVISVPKDYEVAAEVVLGGSLQHLLTENDDSAQEAIKWLKNNDKGRVTFLPLNTIKGGRNGDKIPQGPSVLGCLCDLIRYEQRFANIMEYLLGRVWLVEDLSTAVAQAKATHFRYRIVTLDGQVVNAGGSLTGGSSRINSSGILSRKRNIEEITSSIRELEEQLQKGNKKIREQERTLKDLDKAIAALKDQIQELNIKKVENAKTQERWQADQERYKADLESIQWHKNELLQERTHLTRLVKDTEKDIAELKERISGSALNIQEMQEKVRLNRHEKIKKNEKLTLLRIEVATVEEKIASYQKESNYFIQRLSQLAQQRDEKQKSILGLREKRADLEKSFSTMESAKAQHLSELRDLETKLEQMRALRQGLIQGIEEIGAVVKKNSALLRDKEDKLHQYEVMNSKYETSLEAALRRLEEQYSLEMEKARESYEPVKDRKAAAQRIGELKDEILNLGTVNLGAIEEYVRLKERLSFLTEQVADMTEAKDRLLQVIREMDQIMAKKFRETFVLVNEAFQVMFTRLFGGGKAQLMLTQPDNILETGIDIIAQPPGKKTQFLSLLSGGEKALTAIALLMAVLKIKPSPFCVLDEIESNLDEANVQRFAGLLEEFSKDTQFVVISHHKGTMEVADMLYGITIEETGVSRLVSVKLEDASREAS